GSETLRLAVYGRIEHAGLQQEHLFVNMTMRRVRRSTGGKLRHVHLHAESAVRFSVEHGVALAVGAFLGGQVFKLVALRGEALRTLRGGQRGEKKREVASVHRITPCDASPILLLRNTFFGSPDCPTIPADGRTSKKRRGPCRRTWS